MKLALALTAAALIAGCASIDDEGVGASIAGNMDAQIIDKTPAEGAPKGDAQVTATAVGRYKTGQVKDPSPEEKDESTITIKQ